MLDKITEVLIKLDGLQHYKVYSKEMTCYISEFTDNIRIYGECRGKIQVVGNISKKMFVVICEKHCARLQWEAWEQHGWELYKTR